MMGTYLATIAIMLRPLVNDPQGLAVLSGLQQLGFSGARGVRVGKRIEVTMEAEHARAAREATRAMCQQLLANPVIEDFSFAVTAVAPVAAD